MARFATKTMRAIELAGVGCQSPRAPPPPPPVVEFFFDRLYDISAPALLFSTKSPSKRFEVEIDRDKYYSYRGGRLLTNEYCCPVRELPVENRI